MITNPRHPHTVKITRETNTGSSDIPVIVPVVVLESVCRNYITTKSSETNGVMSSDHTISLPRHTVDIRTGDTIEVIDVARTINGTVLASQINNIGANIYYNEIKN